MQLIRPRLHNAKQNAKRQFVYGQGLDVGLDLQVCKFMYTHFGNQYTGETITTCNLRMNIHRRRKSGNEMSIDHYSNVS